MKGLLLLIFIALLTLKTGTVKAGTIATDSIKFIRLELAGDNIRLRDETLILFKNGAKSDYIPEEDVKYFQGAGQVRLFSYSSNGFALVFNRQPFPDKTSNIKLNVFTRSDGRYQLKMSEIAGVPKLYGIWLVDNLLKDSIDLRNNPSYSFNVSKADTNSFGGRRFKVIIKHNKALESRLLSFAADKIASTKQVKLEWRTENEEYSTTYTVERSTDKGKTFNALDSVRSASKGLYNLTDSTPVDGLNLYRLKQTNSLDSISYSSIVRIDNSVVPVLIPTQLNITKNTLNIYPNPVAGLLNVGMKDKSSAITYSISVTNIWGMKVKEGTTSGTDWQSEVGDLRPGIYLVTVTNNVDKSLVGRNKFLKK
jgi:hypothetical protein